jgi:hypothetical protein
MGNKHYGPFGKWVFISGTGPGFRPGTSANPFYPYDFQAQPAHKIEDAIQVRLIADLTDQG